MWLLNHVAARKFEIPMLKRAGFNEIFLPKIFPSEVRFRSANVDYSEDANLTIPAAVLERLNGIDWYSSQSAETWQIATQYFDIAFFIVNDLDAATTLLRYFGGAAVWRAYGLDKSQTYTKISRSQGEFEPAAVRARSRFWFGQAYENLAGAEAEHIKQRSIFLPLGLPDASMADAWRGQDPRMLFVCPDLGFNTYYQDVYERFKQHFGDLPYVVGGSQPVHVDDPKVLGFLSAEEYARNMRELRVMFYHSREPRHIHYHPFEAIRAGMPLVFMADGMLDSMGGKALPGRATTFRHARQLLERLLSGDEKLTQAIRSSQTVLLEAMDFESMVPQWKSATSTILKELDTARATLAPSIKRKKKRIAVLVPIKYRGGSLRGAKLLAKAILLGSRRAGEEAEVVIGHLDDQNSYDKRTFDDVHDGIKVRPFDWLELNHRAATRAMVFAGSHHWKPSSGTYLAPDDGMKQFGDCDVWIIISDRLSKPILPIRPTIMMVYDYIQRYIPLFREGADAPYRKAARAARQVLVTTEFTRQGAIAYAGVDADKVFKVPMLAPELPEPDFIGTGVSKNYFLWSTNAAPHKNHATALQALSIYYNSFGGELDCVVTGVNSGGLVDDSQENLRAAGKMLANSRILRQRLKVVGELDDMQYRAALKGAAFLWHPGSIDNGTFSVVEAARFGVPALSSDYPAMREIDAQFQLNLAFSPSDDAQAMAERLKWMQDNLHERKSMLPGAEVLAGQSVDQLSDAYWAVVRGAL